MEQEWISLNEFMRRNKMGRDAALRLITAGKLEYEKSETGQYKIKVSKSEKVDEYMEKLIRENQELRALLATIKNISNQVKVWKEVIQMKLSYKQKYELLKIAILTPIIIGFFAAILIYPFM